MKPYKLLGEQHELIFTPLIERVQISVVFAFHSVLVNHRVNRNLFYDSNAIK